MSESNVYDTYAPKLLERGFYPLPIGPNSKKPQHFVPSLNEFRDTQGWTHPARRPDTSPQPGAGIGVRVGKQADGSYLVAIDWDNDEAAIAAMDIFPPTVTKEGARGFTAFYKSSAPIASHDFRVNGRAAAQVLSDGRQTVVPPTMHPDAKRPYTWTSKYTLYSISSLGELPEIPADYVERIEKILRPLGYEPEPVDGRDDDDRDHGGGDRDGDPFWELNKLAMRNLAAWVPDLNLYNCQRQRGRYASYEAVATWRPSTTGRPLEQRDRNLSISGDKGITDFGTNEKFSPIDLVMRARDCSFSDAVVWLEERLRPGERTKADELAETILCNAPSNANTDAGMTDQSGPSPPPRKPRFKLISYIDMRVGMNEVPYLVHELIPSRGIVVVWGAPKCYKSFWLHDLMLHIAKGWEYHDRFVQQGPVVYCAFEGGHGYTKRIEAQRRHYGHDDDPPLYTMPGQANLIGEHSLLVRDIRSQLPEGTKPLAVVLDTLNRSFVGSENNPVDMTAYTRAAEAIREAFDCVVIIVHHCGWDATRPRGHSSLPAAVDAELSVTREGDVATIEVQYMRDGPEGTQVVVKSKVVEVGFDASGQVLTSLVMIRHDAAEYMPGQPVKWPNKLKVLKSAIVEALLSQGFDHKIENGPTVRAVDLEKVRAVFYNTNVVASGEDTIADHRQRAQQLAFKRGVQKAQEAGLIGAMFENGRQLIWMASASDEPQQQRWAA
jgi:hypothetical protein